MQLTFEIARRELKNYFLTPVGWIILILYLLQLGSLLVANLQSRTLRAWSISEDNISLTYGFLFHGSNSLIVGMVSNLYLIIPLMTMGLIARELADGTIKMLFSSPVKINHIIGGKFLAVAVFSLILTLFLALFGFALNLYVIENFDFRLFLWALLLFYLLLLTYLSIGLYISSLTSYPFVAAVGVVGVLMFLGYARSLSYDGIPDFLQVIIDWMQGISFLYTFKGFIGVWDLLYFVLLISMFIAFTYIRLTSLKTNKGVWNLALKYLGVLFVVLSIGYISSLPEFRYFIDARSEVVNDTILQLSRDDVAKWRLVLMQLIPGVLIVATSAIIIVRKRR